MSRIRAPASASSSVRSHAAPAAADDGRRVIKKYPNRRLYDTKSSSYITLAQVRALVMAREAFVVREAKSGEDLTRSILLQIILEEEAGGAPIFSEAALEGIILFYGHALQGFMGSYLEKNVQALMDIQARLAEQPNGFTPEMWTQFMHMHSPMMQGVVGNYLEQSKNMFLQMQEQMSKQTEQVWGAFLKK